MSAFKENVAGIYLNAVGDASGGTQPVLSYDYSAENVHDIEWLPDASGFLFTKFHVELGYFSDVVEYNFATQSSTMLTPSLNDGSEDGGALGLSISADGRQVVFERAVYPFNTNSSLWIMNRDGSAMHKLADVDGALNALTRRLTLAEARLAHVSDPVDHAIRHESHDHALQRLSEVLRSVYTLLDRHTRLDH